MVHKTYIYRVWLDIRDVKICRLLTKMPLNESKVKHTYKRSRMRHEARMERKKKKTSKSVILDG